MGCWSLCCHWAVVGESDRPVSDAGPGQHHRFWLKCGYVSPALLPCTIPRGTRSLPEVGCREARRRQAELQDDFLTLGFLSWDIPRAGTEVWPSSCVTGS